jgi:hypothetical protein
MKISRGGSDRKAMRGRFSSLRKMFHNLADRLHQVTAGPSTWSLIALEPTVLDEYARIFSLVSPPPRSGRKGHPSAGAPRSWSGSRRC